MKNGDESSTGSGYEGVAEFYDLFAENDDLPFYLDYAKKQGSPILDLAAGTLRVSIPLAESGFQVWALESSPSMLEGAKNRLHSLPERVTEKIRLVEGDMTDFELKESFRLIIVPNSFGHALTTEKQLSTLGCVREHLAEDGVFVLDLFPGGMQPEHATFTTGPRALPDGKLVTREGEMNADFVKQFLSVKLRYTVRDHVDKEILEVVEVNSGAALIFNREADLLIRMAGLEVVEEFGDFQQNHYTPESGRRILVLRKTM